MFARFLKDESGATAIEYGLIAALIAVAIIGGVTALGSERFGKFHKSLLKWPNRRLRTLIT
jgi:pilus assembly protein Flp/PilA